MSKQTPYPSRTASACAMTPAGASIRARIADLESAFGGYEASIDGHVWRWLDTSAEGPAVVLLPGSVGDAMMFCKLLEMRERLPRLVAVTYPGLWEPHKLATGLAAVLDSIGLDEVVLVGSSFGAYWAQFFAAEMRHRVRALVLGNGFTEADDLRENPLFDRAWVESVASSELHRVWLDRVRAMPSTELSELQAYLLADRQTPENLHARFLGVVRSTVAPALAPDLPVTIIDCPDDPVIPAAMHHRLRQRHAGAVHVSIAGGGHHPHVLFAHAYASVIAEAAADPTPRQETPDAARLQAGVDVRRPGATR